MSSENSTTAGALAAVENSGESVPVVEEDSLVEEISIDGMCGVY